MNFLFFSSGRFVFIFTGIYRMGWELCLQVIYWGNIHSKLSGIAFWAFLFPGAAVLLEAASSGPLLSGPFLEENFLIFEGVTLVSWLFRVTNWFLAGEEFNLLEGFPLPAVSWRSILTSSSLETDFLFLGLERDGSSLPFSCGASWGFCFFFFMVKLLFQYASPHSLNSFWNFY